MPHLLLCFQILLLQVKNQIRRQNVLEILEEANFSNISYQVISDSPEQLLALVEQHKAQYPLILTVGGTGLGPKDLTVETLSLCYSVKFPA